MTFGRYIPIQQRWINAYIEKYIRFLQAKRDYPNLNHVGHEPSIGIVEPSHAEQIRAHVEREFYRTS